MLNLANFFMVTVDGWAVRLLLERVQEATSKDALFIIDPATSRILPLLKEGVDPARPPHQNEWLLVQARTVEALFTVLAADEDSPFFYGTRPSPPETLKHFLERGSSFSEQVGVGLSEELALLVRQDGFKSRPVSLSQ